MNSITECLERINGLTQQNLDILKTINDSFFTKKEHLVVNVEDNRYVIPSFIALENKVNALQEGLNNLVNAPATGEAYFNYDGNSKTIQVRGFNNTPNAIVLDKKNTERFYVEQNSIFKDLITPNAYLRFDLTTIPDDIPTVLVKKITPITSAAKEILQSQLEIINEDETITTLTTNSVAYKDLYKQLTALQRGIDYEEYNTIRQLPIRQSIGTGTYVISKILEDKILSDLTEQLVLEISVATPLTYKKFDETIDIDLEVGQYLTTYNDRVKLQIVDINTRNHQLTLNVVNGDYLDLTAYEGTVDVTNLDDIQEMCKLRFFSVNDYDKYKYIDVTLEEDQYIGIFIAPLNPRMNVQAPWGYGVVVNTYVIKNEAGDSYENYYKENVTNIGDILKEIVSINNSSISRYNKEEFDEFTSYKPVIDTNNLTVTQINRHLNDSPTVTKIRSLYAQKKQYEIDLTEVQNKITSINQTLATISFDDTTNIRSIYQSQLDGYTKKKNETVAAINSVINEISLAVNNSEIPIENAKYHIRGYFEWDSAKEGVSLDEVFTKYSEHVKGIKVEYRYKNQDQTTGTAESFQNGNFIYSDWNLMSSFDRVIIPSNNGDRYTFNYEPNSDKDNIPSFNQIDIPISQGESVDIRLKIVWDFGAPYIETTSAWSEVVNIEFPQEYLKDVQLLTIINENNNDIETNRFNNILIDNGIMRHVDDKLTDQDLTYFHHPEHIASGFYTEERRVIPLKDKLTQLDSAVIGLEDTVYGSNSDNIKVEFIFDSTTTEIFPFQSNTVNVDVELPDLSSFDGTNINDYIYIANLKITNTSKRTIRLFSIFPGNRNITIESSGHGIYDKDKNYLISLVANQKLINESSGSYFIPPSQSYQYKSQVRNQFIYQRSKDVFNGGTILNAFTRNARGERTTNAIIALLLDKGIYQVCIDSNNVRDYKVLNAGETIILPVVFTYTYSYTDGTETIFKNLSGDLEFSFDLRMSLYNDPQNYFIRVHRLGAKDITLHKKIVESQSNLTKYDSVIAKIY